MFKIRHITEDQYRLMPWKSHRGTTAEIFIFPENSNFHDDSYFWRVSSDSIASSCPFSQFLGFDRTIVLIEGDTMALNHDCVENPQMVQRLIPYRFKGEWQTTCEMSDQAVKDFNLIARRGKVIAELDSLNITQSGPLSLNLLRDQTLIFCVSGKLKVTGAGFRDFQIASSDTLMIEKLADPALDGSGLSAMIQACSITQNCEVILVQVSLK